MGINDLSKKYNLNEIIKGDSIFATGITSGDLASGIKINKDKFISETLVTHKYSGLKKGCKIKSKNNTISLINHYLYNKSSILVPSSIG